MIYFTADLHFNHFNAIRLCNRPFNSVEEMNESMISNWNKTVNYKDTIYILGDFGQFASTEDANYMLNRLNGTKYFIQGNHDYFLKEGKKLDVVWVKDYFKLNYKKTGFIMCHYPIHEWDGFFRNNIMLHGHLHTNNVSKKQLTDELGRVFDVGVDANNFSPISIEDIINKMEYIENKNYKK